MLHLLVEYKCQECGNTWPSNTDTQTKCDRCEHDDQETESTSSKTMKLQNRWTLRLCKTAFTGTRGGILWSPFRIIA
jgi:hypothetical protein